MVKYINNINRLKINKSDIMFVALSLVTLLFISWTTSPIFEGLGWDSSIFLLIGKSVAKGYEMYVDLFDHKGPILFFINAIPQIFIKGTLGVFIIQVLTMSISLGLIYRISKKYIKNNLSYIMPLLYLAYMSFTYEGGNLSEEYSNLFCLISLYITINYIKRLNNRLYNIEGILLGINFAVVAFIRINNAAPIVACILYIFICMMMHKNISDIVKFIVNIILGALVIIIPIVIYFIINNSLYDMIYATFLYNLKYSSGSLIKNVLKSCTNRYAVVLSIIPLVAILISVIKKDVNNGLLCILNLIVTFIAVNVSGNSYLHYWMTMATPFIYGAIIIVTNLNKNLVNLLNKNYKAIIIMNLIIIIALCIRIYNSVSIEDISNYESEVKKLEENIPQSEKDSVFGYNIESKWFYYSDIIPCNKYFTLQDWWSSHDKSISDEIINMLENSPPKWIIIPIEDNSIENKKIEYLIYDNYYEVERNSTGILLKIKDIY